MAKRNQEKVRAHRRAVAKLKRTNYRMKLDAREGDTPHPSTKPTVPEILKSRKVIGQVTGKTFGGMFLRTKEGVRIYLPYVVLNQWENGRRLKPGESLVLMAYPNEHGLRATEVLGELL